MTPLYRAIISCFLSRSPNFPGLYPRNTTCSYRVLVRKSEVPRGRHALVAVSQLKADKVGIRAEYSSKKPATFKFGGKSKQASTIGLWSDCDAVGDRVTVYDGQDTKAPKLISFCR